MSINFVQNVVNATVDFAQLLVHTGLNLIPVVGPFLGDVVGLVL
jgi:hypothetical protein